jgi:hypothetical protein
MLTSDLKAKEAIYEVVEPRYFEKAQKNTLNGSPSTRATTIFR